MEVISSITAPPENIFYNAMCEQFGVKPQEVRRLSRIDLLVSICDNSIHPQKHQTLGKMTLYDGPLGKVFGGSWSSLKFSPSVTCYPASVHPVASGAVKTTTMKAAFREYIYMTPAKTEQEILEFFQEENIGVEYSLRCGGCQWRKCAS